MRAGVPAARLLACAARGKLLGRLEASRASSFAIPAPGSPGCASGHCVQSWLKRLLQGTICGRWRSARRSVAGRRRDEGMRCGRICGPRYGPAAPTLYWYMRNKSLWKAGLSDVSLWGSWTNEAVSLTCKKRMQRSARVPPPPPPPRRAGAASDLPCACCPGPHACRPGQCPSRGFRRMCPGRLSGGPSGLGASGDQACITRTDVVQRLRCQPPERGGVGWWRGGRVLW